MDNLKVELTVDVKVESKVDLTDLTDNLKAELTVYLTVDSKEQENLIAGKRWLLYTKY